MHNTVHRCTLFETPIYEFKLDTAYEYKLVIGISDVVEKVSMFHEWEHNFVFCALSKLIILLQLVVLRPRFFPDRCTTVFFRVFAHNIFTPDARCAVVFIMALFWL